jgi:uncharacterized LabA/DUF88 family protein
VEGILSNAGQLPRTNVYVDGFNLYYGVAQDSPWKWLDLRALCERMLPRNDVHRIKYFTAHIQARPGGDPRQPQRQLTYLRALQTVRGLTIYRGQFLSHTRRMPRAKPTRGGAKTVEVIFTEEKGSDVNLATHLLVDGFRRDYEMAVVVSNDSDLAYPVSVVRRELKLRVGVIAPVLIPDTRPGRAAQPARRVSVELSRAANFVWTMDPSVLAACQFPPTLTDAHGTITKPPGW